MGLGEGCAKVGVLDREVILESVLCRRIDMVSFAQCPRGGLVQASL